jgi:phosphatidylserine/phosphatidylglycerophosphate/cardiolipin synthase-like enzyme
MKKALYILLCLITVNASAQYAGGKIKIYFNRPVDDALATNYPAVFLNQTWADTLCAYINRAKYTIDVAQYDYSYTSTVANIATAINSAYSRGVVVRWIYNGSSTNSALTNLNSGISKLASPTSSAYNIMHDKFVIIDANSVDTLDPIVWTGSNDWSQEMVDSDYNNIIIFQNQPLARAYTAQFNQMWGGSGATPVTANEKFGPFKTDLGPHIFNIGGSTVELYFSPTDSTNNHILDVINSANSQLYFGVYELTETNDANAIVAKKNAGLSVAGCVDQYDSTNGGTAFTILRTGLGSDLKVYAQNYSIYHNKYVIADPCNTASDPQVLTGSHNWTTSADTKNDENTVIIHNADVANIYYQAFYANFTQFNGILTPCTVTNPCAGAITATTQVNSNVKCYGQSTGSATVNAHGQHGPFTYTWSSSPVQTDSILTNVAAGTYTVTVKDANSCTATATATISQPSGALSIAVTETNATCYGSGNGTATATVTGGTTSYVYKWSSTPQQVTATASSLPSGAYTVTVTDANSCTATASATISQPGAVTVAGSVTDNTCYNGTTGKITVTPSGGSGTYSSYIWSTVPQQATATASGLAAGSYTVTVTDSHGCTGTGTYTVTQPATGITLTTGEVNASCGGSTGSASVTVSPSATYTYSWSGGGTSATAANLAAGSYTVTVTAASGGCTATASVQVNSTGGPTVTPSHTNTTCGLSNGSAQVSVSGGQSPYSYIWSTSSTSPSISNLASGVYTVTVKDANSCASIASITVTASSGVVLNASSTSTTCGLSNGAASVTVTSPSSPTYLWSNTGTTASITGLSSGSYTVTVTNSGCTAVTSVSVAASSAVSFSSSSTPTTCGENNGSASVTVTNPSNPSYQWNNNATTASIIGLASGSYTVTITNAGTCTAVTTLSVAPSTGVQLQTSSTDASCGGSNGSATVSVTSPSNPTYLWSNSGTAATISNVGVGVYTVTVVNGGTCSATASVTVGSGAGTTGIAVTADRLTVCYGDSAHLCAANGYTTYQWSTAASGDCIYAHQSGSYSVTATNTSGCTATSTPTVIVVYPADPASFSISGITLTASPGASYQWLLNGTPISGAVAPVWVAVQTGQYSVQVTDSNGCINTSSQQLVSINGIENISSNDEVKIYPNPLSTGHWQLEVSSEWIGSTVEISDMAGKIVFQSVIQNQKTEILADLPSGVYITKINSNSRSYIQKLVKLQ